MYHYTYKIHYSTDKYYVGVRSSECYPKEDDKYIGSSKYTPNDKIVKKEILGVFDTRKDALKNEMNHHIFNNVVKNDMYYNRALQNGTKFDSKGRKQSKEHRDKIAAKSRGRVMSKESREKISIANKGKKHKPRTEEWKASMSKANKGKTSPFKGKKFTTCEKEKAYASRLKYPEEREWYNKKTSEEFIGNTQELALILGSDTNMVSRVIDGKVKSYHGWYLKKSVTDQN